MHTIRHFYNRVIPSIVFVIAVLSCPIFSCGFSTGSSAPRRQSIDISEWIGDYQGTATFVAPKRQANENEWDPRWKIMKSMDGKVQTIEIRIFHAPDNPNNIVDIELHLEYPIVSFDPLNSSSSIRDVYFHLNPSRLSSNTVRADQYIERQSYTISLTRTITTITGTFASGSRVYQLNLEKK